MKKWNEVFGEGEAISIQSLAKYVNQYLQQEWVSVLKEKEDELRDIFADKGEYAYAVYSGQLFAPLHAQITDAGLILKPGFRIQQSIEHWGPPEERERCLWCVVKQADGHAIGTLVMRMHHSHVKFQVPSRPEVFALEETEEKQIIQSIQSGSTRLKGHIGGVLHEDIASQPDVRWEYSAETGLSDYLDEHDPFEVSEIDHALTQWGRNGWELTSVVSHEGRIIAFFKRPVS